MRFFFAGGGGRDVDAGASWGAAVLRPHMTAVLAEKRDRRIIGKALKAKTPAGCRRYRFRTQVRTELIILYKGNDCQERFDVDRDQDAVRRPASA
jgi:hypothetical protein